MKFRLYLSFKEGEREEYFDMYIQAVFAWFVLNM